jgi:hypothetical protein
VSAIPISWSDYRRRRAPEPWQHLLNCIWSLQADPIGLLTEVADLAGLDAGRLRQWLFARCVQGSLGEGPRWPMLDVVLHRLGGP